MGQAEIAAASLDSQFAELEASDSDIELEARLAALKAGSAPAPQIEPMSVTQESETQDAVTQESVNQE